VSISNEWGPQIGMRLFHEKLHNFRLTASASAGLAEGAWTRGLLKLTGSSDRLIGGHGFLVEAHVEARA
jgi:hypothetical protein